MATATGTFLHSPPNPGHVKLYPGLVDVLHQATHPGYFVSLNAWANLHENNLKGYPGYARKPLGLPKDDSNGDQRLSNLKNVTSDRHLRFYLEFLKATDVLDETAKPSLSWLKDNWWLSLESTVLLEWANWHLLARFALPVRNVPIQLDLLSEFRNSSRKIYPFSKGDIFGVRVLKDQDVENSYFFSGDSITILGGVIDTRE